MKQTLFVLTLAFSLFTGSLAHALFDEDFYLKQCEAESTILGDYSSNPDGLSEAERIALYRYTAAAYDTLNPLLGKGLPLTDCQAAEVQFIDQALAKIPRYEGTVYRGTSTRSFAARVGEVVTLKPYTSTSPSEESAEAFIRNRILIVEVRSGRLIHPYSNAPWEEEVLLPRNTRIRINKVVEEIRQIFNEEFGHFEERQIEIVYAEEV